MLVDNLLKLKKISLGLIKENDLNEELCHLLSKLKLLKVIQITCLLRNFQNRSFENLCLFPQVTFFQMDLFLKGWHNTDLTCFLSFLPRIFPNLQHFSVHSHDVQSDAFLDSLNKLKNLKIFRLKTCETNNHLLQTKLIPFCNQKNIQMSWTNCCDRSEKAFDAIYEYSIHFPFMQHIKLFWL